MRCSRRIDGFLIFWETQTLARWPKASESIFRCCCIFSLVSWASRNVYCSKVKSIFFFIFFLSFKFVVINCYFINSLSSVFTFPSYVRLCLQNRENETRKIQHTCHAMYIFSKWNHAFLFRWFVYHFQYLLWQCELWINAFAFFFSFSFFVAVVVVCFLLCVEKYSEKLFAKCQPNWNDNECWRECGHLWMFFYCADNWNSSKEESFIIHRATKKIFIIYS